MTDTYFSSVMRCQLVGKVTRVTLSRVERDIALEARLFRPPQQQTGPSGG